MARVAHFEIHADDAERAIRFYSQVFGWAATRWGEMPYWMLRTGEAPEAGIDGAILPRRGPGPKEGQPVNAFVCTVNVSDVDATLAKAIEAGGQLAVPKMAVPGVGWLAYVKDTEGNILGMMQDDPSAR